MPNYKFFRRIVRYRQAYRAYEPPRKETTQPLYSQEVDFDQRLPILRVANFEDEPTIPRGLCHWTDEENTDINLP